MPALTEFILFHDRVYEYRSARWPASPALQLPVLLGESPFAVERRLCPFAARQGGAIVARAVALVDERYRRHWKETLGHIVMFEALPDTREAVRMLIDAACKWLGEQGCSAARTGFGLLEFPFVIDDYESLPPSVVRQNPDYYHALLKDAGFETEQGWVDYIVEVTPELRARYQDALEAARRAGFEVVPLREISDRRRVRDFTSTWNEAFAKHWGATPFTEDEIAELFASFAISGSLDTSLLAYRGDEPVAAVMATAEASAAAVVRPGRVLKEWEKLNFLAIGVREVARGQGVNLAIAARSYLELMRRGASYLSYTMVLDDNWPSRRTAEKLGAHARANYLAYRRNFTP